MTATVRRKVLRAIRAGNYREVAAQCAGITPQTLRNYLRRADDPEAKNFFSAILEAEAKVESELVSIIKKLADGDLKAATWYLSHKFPQRWADNSKELKEILRELQNLNNGKSRRKSN